MAAAHFDLLPGLALQIAGRVEAYCVAMRSFAADPQRTDRLDVATRAVLDITEMSRPVSSLWSEWGRFVAAHADFNLARAMQPDSPQLRSKLLALDQAAEALMAQAVRWALFGDHQAAVSVDVAHAFIEWDAARQVYFGIRQAGSVPQAPRAIGDDPGVMATPMGQLDAKWESKCAALLLEAVQLLGLDNWAHPIRH